jgi:hypothetical protein
MAIEGDRTIPRSVVQALTTVLCQVMNVEEEPYQAIMRNPTRVEGNPNRLNMTVCSCTRLLMGRAFNNPAGVVRGRRHDSRNTTNHIFAIPETASHNGD